MRCRPQQSLGEAPAQGRPRSALGFPPAEPAAPPGSSLARSRNRRNCTAGAGRAQGQCRDGFIKAPIQRLKTCRKRLLNDSFMPIPHIKNERKHVNRKRANLHRTSSVLIPVFSFGGFPAHKMAAVLPWLYLGSRNDAKNLDFLVASRVCYILNVTPTRAEDPVAGVPNFFEKDKRFTYARCNFIVCVCCCARLCVYGHGKGCLPPGRSICFGLATCRMCMLPVLGHQYLFQWC